MIANLWSIWIVFFCVFFCDIIMVNHFLNWFIILIHLISFFVHYFIICSICICFYWINWLYSFIIISTQCSCVNFFGKYIMFLASKSLLWFLRLVYYFSWIFYIFSNTICKNVSKSLKYTHERNHLIVILRPAVCKFTKDWTP